MTGALQRTADVLSSASLWVVDGGGMAPAIAAAADDDRYPTLTEYLLLREP
jgi:hypothetical protein